MTDLMRDRVIVALGDLYDIGPEIGRGGMALVYRATDLRLRRQVAVKVLPPELAFREEVRQRFLREAETSARLSHPNIVPIYSVDDRGGMSFFVMALIKGESLGARLLREPRPPIDTVRRILCDVADALAFAHARGVVHRDIKPDNILLDSENGRVMVTDFGIARAAEADARLTVTGIAVGTPTYMSPEQALGEREIDGRSDLYSLGVVAYQMLAGELPFKAATTPAMMMKHISDTPRPLRTLRQDIPPSLAAAVERALGKQPEQRWPDAGAFRDAVARESGVAAEYPAVQRPGQAAPPPWPNQRPDGAGRGIDGARPEIGGSRDAGRNGWAPPEGRPSAVPPVPPSSALPLGYPVTRRDWKELRRQQRQQWRQQAQVDRHAARDPGMARPVEERIQIFRRSLAGYGGAVVMLGGINMLTSPHFPWFVFPALGMGMPVIRQLGGLWADRVSFKQIFGRAPVPAVGAGAPQGAALPSPHEAAARLVPADVLDGPHGGAVKRAVADRAAIQAVVDSLAKPDRDLLPEVGPTADALVERVAALVPMLHHLDADASPELMAQLDRRIADVERESEDAADRERRLTLLTRQRATLKDLSERRGRVAAQLESAAIALQNLKLDLIKLRSSGVQSALQDVNGATREARALSRDIGNVVEAADELRKL